jgi:ABC-type multidrug transport system fused ATPase/permease subunit
MPAPGSSWAEALALIATHRARLACGLGLLLVELAAGFVLPLVAKTAIDRAVPTGDTGLLGWLALAVLGAGLARAGAGFALSQVISVAAQRAVADLRKQVHDHVLRLPISAFDQTQSGTLSTRIMRDAEGVRNLIGTGLVQLIGGILTAVVAVGILLWMHVGLTLVMLVILAGYGGLLSLLFRRLRPIFRQRNDVEARLTGRLTQALAGIRVVKAFAGEERERAAFATSVDGLFGMIRRTMTGVATGSAGAALAVALAAAAILHLGAGAVLAGTLSPGDLVAYIALLALVASPVFQLASVGTQITESLAGLDRIRALRAQPTEDAGDAALAPLGAVQGAVRLAGVSFAYGSGHDVLQAIDLDIPCWAEWLGQVDPGRADHGIPPAARRSDPTRWPGSRNRPSPGPAPAARRGPARQHPLRWHRGGEYRLRPARRGARDDRCCCPGCCLRLHCGSATGPGHRGR